MERMTNGPFEVLQIAKDSAKRELYRVTGSVKLSLAWKKSQRMIAGSAGLYLLISLLGILAIILVVKRRFELFPTI